MGAGCCKATDYFIDLTVLAPEDIDRHKEAVEAAANKTYEVWYILAVLWWVT